MSTDEPQTIESLMKSVGNLSEKLDQIAEQPGASVNKDGSAVSYFMPADSPDVQGINYNQSAMQSLSKKMPKGYRGANNEDAKFDGFGSFLKSGLKDHSTSDWQKRQQSIYKGIEGMSISQGADGGFLVPPEYTNEILDRTYSNDIYSRCRNYTIGTNSMKFKRNAETSRRNGSRNGGLMSYWIGEGQKIPDSHPKLKKVELDCNKLAVVVFLTEELINDSNGAAERFVNDTVGDEFNFRIGDAIFNGSGVGQPLGVFNAPNRVQIVKDLNQPANTISESNIDRMWERRCASGGNYEWYHNQDCCAELDGLTQDVGTGGVALMRPNGSIATAPYQSIKGARRNETEFSETLGTSGDLALLDLNQYLTISHGGITQASSMHVEFLSDQQALRFIMRIDGKPWEDTPITPFKGTNLQSATILLEDRN